VRICISYLSPSPCAPRAADLEGQLGDSHCLALPGVQEPASGSPSSGPGTRPPWRCVTRAGARRAVDEPDWDCSWLLGRSSLGSFHKSSSRDLTFLQRLRFPFVSALLLYLNPSLDFRNKRLLRDCQKPHISRSAPYWRPVVDR
jgi:hypothetical protein